MPWMSMVTGASRLSWGLRSTDSQPEALRRTSLNRPVLILWHLLGLVSTLQPFLDQTDVQLKVVKLVSE